MSVNGNQPRGIVLSASGVITTAATSSMASPATWYQVVASTSAAIYITAVCYTTAAGGAGTIDIGTGSAASEVAVITVSAFATTSYYNLPYPLRVPAGTRIAARASGTSSTLAGIVYVNESAVV